MRTVVAGGAGFIGSRLCTALLGRGHEVICIDNLVTGRWRNVARLDADPMFSFVQHDLTEPLPDLPLADIVFHLASPASPPGYQRLPSETLRVNSEGTRHLLEFSERSGARFLFASTSEAYGDPLEHPQREEYRGNVSPVGPRSAYDEGKRFGEAMTMAFLRTRRVDARIVRIFNTYGPSSDPADGRLVPNLMVQALRGEPMTVYGTGNQTRSLCYVSDLVEGLLKAALLPGARGEVINLGNPEEHTVLEFVEIIRALAHSRSQVVFSTGPVGDDPQRRQPDITKAKRLLGWEPTVGLYEGLERTIDYFRQELDLMTPHTSVPNARTQPARPGT